MLLGSKPPTKKLGASHDNAEAAAWAWRSRLPLFLLSSPLLSSPPLSAICFSPLSELSVTPQVAAVARCSSVHNSFASLSGVEREHSSSQLFIYQSLTCLLVHTNVHKARGCCFASNGDRSGSASAFQCNPTDYQGWQSPGRPQSHKLFNPKPWRSQTFPEPWKRAPRSNGAKRPGFFGALHVLDSHVLPTTHAFLCTPYIRTHAPLSA